MPQEVRAEYPCTTQELYSIGHTIYDNVITHLPEFAALKAKYTVPFVDDLRVKIDAAKAMPDEEMRNSVFQALGVELGTLEQECCSNFQDLKTYVTDSYEKSFHKFFFDAAGAPKYAVAKDGNHERCAGMNADMIAFIAEHEAVLLNTLSGDANMPVGFKAKVNTDATTFNNAYDAFKAARQTTTETHKKLQANNDCFKQIMQVCEDGIRVAAKSSDPTGVAKLFTFKTVKEIVSPPGSTSLKIIIKSLFDGQPKVGLTVSIHAEGGPVLNGVTDETGVVLFKDIDPADYTVTISGGGMPMAIVLVKEVNTGVQARKEVLV